MRKRTLLVTLLALAAACGADPTDQSDLSSAESADVGTLHMSLTGVDTQMRLYRLRNATFSIEGTRYTDFQFVSTSVSSDTDLDSPVVRTRLAYGSYSVTLGGPWYIERLSADPPERVESVTLLSPATQSVFIQQGLVSQLAFQIGVDGEAIDFFGGDLEIGISIQLPASATPPVMGGGG